MAREMLDVVQRLSIERSVRVVVVTGAGSDAFCPGTDTKAFLSSADNPDLEPDPLLEDMMFRIPVILYQMPQVTIAAINAATAGAGFELGVRLRHPMGRTIGQVQFGVPRPRGVCRQVPPPGHCGESSGRLSLVGRTGVKVSPPTPNAAHRISSVVDLHELTHSMIWSNMILYLKKYSSWPCEREEMISLKGKVAIVTGAASGIGAATAKLLASAGAAVLIADLNLEGANAVVDEIRADGQTAEAVRADVSEEDEVRGLIEATRASFGRLDILDNNAGLLGSPDDLDVVRMDVDLWDRFFAVNTRGPMLMCKHAVPLMIEGGGGSIINIASSGTSWGNARSTAYYCSKNAVIALTRFVAMQHLKDGIRCNTVSPGMVGSESARQLWKQRGLQDAIDVRLMRDGESLDLARVVLFLASELSEFMTGQLLTVDGGLTAGSPLFPETHAALQLTNPRPAPN